MSYTIEYARKCLVGPKPDTGSPGLDEPNLYLFVKDGDNNVHPLPKTWRLVADGWEFSVIQEVCNRAGYAAGGMIQLVHGFAGAGRTTPENYLKLYRQCIADAEPLTIEALRGLGFTEVGYRGLQLERVGQFNEHLAERFQKVAREFEKAEAERWSGGDYNLTRSLQSVEDFLLWVEGRWVMKKAGAYPFVQSSQNE
jgi:hypothetical protein